MKKRSTSGSKCDQCRKSLKTSSSSQVTASRACGCSKKKAKNLSKSNQSRQSADQSHSVNHNNQYISQQMNPQRYATLDQRQPPQIYVDNQQPLTNLRIQSCEFPSAQTVRNSHPHNMFSLESSVQAHSFQQPSYYNQIQTPVQMFTAAAYSPYKNSNPSRYETSYNKPQQPQFSPASKETLLTPSKQILSHYERVVQEFDLYSKQRMLNLKEGLNKLVEGLKADEVINTMREDPLSQNFAYHRMKEIIDNALLADSEQVIGNLRAENVMLREKILMLEAETQKKLDQEKIEKQLKKTLQGKNHYKNLAKESQNQIASLLDKLKEYEAEISRISSDYEVKLASKDAELARCEKQLSEVRAILSDKTLSQNRLENNLSGEVNVLSDRVMLLEREKSELIEKYAKYGEEFKILLGQEQTQFNQKIAKQKEVIKELRSKAEKQESVIKELETQQRTYVKEIDEQRHKIEELVKKGQEKGYKLKDFQEKQNIQEKDQSHQIKEIKSKYKAKIFDLQKQFEQTLQDKINQIEAEAKQKINQLDNEKREIEFQFIQLKQTVDQTQEENQQQFIIQQKTTEKKIEKLQVKFEKELVDKIQEAEEQFKDLEVKLRKEWKSEKKTIKEEHQKQLTKYQEEVSQLQEQYEKEYREMSYQLREEIDQLQKMNQEQRIKIAELNIISDNRLSDYERIESEYQTLQKSQKTMIDQHKEEVKLLEQKLQQKVQDSDEKVKLALDNAIKNSNLESVVQQYTHELEKKHKEIESLNDQRNRTQLKSERLGEEIGKLTTELSLLKKTQGESELQKVKISSRARETAIKAQNLIKLYSSKFKQETEYLKRFFLSEIEMYKRQIENQLQSVLSKTKEVQYMQKFKLEKLQYAYEQRFQKEFTQRELEWEKAWEKRDEVIEKKDKVIKELEGEKISLRETIIKMETEVTGIKSQLSLSKKDLTQQCEELKQRLTINDQKHHDLEVAYKKQEEMQQNQFKVQLQDQKLALQQKAQEDLKKFESSIAQYREKTKKKIGDLSQQIQEQQTRHRQELIQFKQIYEEKIKSLEQDNDQKSKTSFDYQNQINVLGIKFDHLEKENKHLQKKIGETKENEKQLNEKLKLLQQSYNTVLQEKEELGQNYTQLQQEAQELTNSNNSLHDQLYAVERKVKKQGLDLKKKTKELTKSKQKEAQEIQFLNNILTSKPTSATKLSRKNSVASPDFRRQTAGYSTSRNRGAMNKENSGNYATILSEINNMLDSNQQRVSSVFSNNTGSLLRSSGKPSSYLMLSPSVNQIHPSMTFYHKSGVSPNRSRISTVENTQMRISDLKQQQ